MLTGRDIVIIASIDWEPLWQSHQEIASRFAAAGNCVLYVENTGVRAPTLREGRRVIRRIRDWVRFVGPRLPRQVRPGLFVYSPVVLPPFGSRTRRAINRLVFLSAVRRVARRLEIRDPIVWTWLPTDTAIDLAEALRLPTRLLIYFCLADFEPLTTHPTELRATELELLRRSDLVFVNTEELQPHRARFADNVHVLPPSVSLSSFHQATVPHRIPSCVTVGYVGGIHAIVDLPLVAECARLRPDWRWVFVGPVQTDTSPVDGLANVELTGPRPHTELRDEIARFDVCIVPYANVPKSQTVAPTKINEYLAVGKPVVATDLPWVREFQRTKPVLQVVSNDPGEFLAGVDRALQTATNPQAATERRQAAAESDWALQLEWVSGEIEKVEPSR